MKLFNLIDLQVIRHYTENNIAEVEDELSRRPCNMLRQNLSSYKMMLDKVNDDIDSHHQIRRVS